MVYDILLNRVTPIVPRFSATLIDAKLQALLERYDVDVPSVFSGPEHLRERLASHALPPDLQAAFEDAEAGLEKSLAAIRDSLARLDKTLIDSAAHA